MNSAGTCKADIEVLGVGQAIPGLRIFCDGWNREARQDVGIGVFRSVLYRKCVHIHEVNPSLYTVALVQQPCKMLKRYVVCLNFEGDPVEHLSVTLDGLDDRGAFQLRNAPLALAVESGLAEVVEGRKESSVCCCFITTPSPSC